MTYSRTAAFAMWLLVSLHTLLWPSSIAAQTLADYTAYPPFINKTVPPNILFIVDLSDATLPAAYGNYPISRKTGTVIAGKLSANVNVSSVASGLDLVSSDDNGVSANSSTPDAPSDVFDASKNYYGLFDSFRCYSTNSNSFIYGSVKTSVSDACGTSQWDGNLLNWMGMRKKDVAYQALIGGTAKPAQANTDGTANSLASENVTGENGTQNKCNNNSSPCWRYVKFLPDATLAGRVPTSLPNPAVTSGGVAVATGRFLGSGEGALYVNDNSGADPFDTASANIYQLKVDLTTEPNDPSGTGSREGNCIVGDPDFAGHLICYQRERSLGLFQKLRTDNMHVGIMFTNADNGKAGHVKFEFDGTFNASAITTIRNEHIQPHAPLAEALYEGLCLFRNSQGPCYNNSPANFSASVGAQGDPFYFVSMNQSVSCCKSFVLMISPGTPISDDNAPDAHTPFGNLFSGDQIGLSSTRLDDVAFYGQTHDVRGDLANTQKVSFYAVNTLGGAAGAAVLMSAAKYGGFEDRDRDGQPSSSGQTCTYPAGSSFGTGSSSSSPEWDADKDCIPDTYFDASQAGDLEATINNAIADILKKSASGTSLSVLATSSTGEGALYQAFFFPSTFEGLNEIKWTGHVEGLFLDSFGNLREDTDGDAKLVYENDHIITTRLDVSTGDVVVDRYLDGNGDGTADSSTPVESVGLRDIKGVWDAGKQLALTDSDNRKILTWVDTDNNGMVDSGEQIEFSTANSATLSPYLRGGAAPYTTENLINFVRGTQVPGLRNRHLTVSGSLRVWKLGDPVHSTPTIVGAPKERYDVIYGDASYIAFFRQYRNRRQVAYVGANDGMLHAFNGGFYQRGDDPSTTVVEHGRFTKNPTDNGSGAALGHELWSFIPYQLLPHLRWLAQTDYTHVYYVDLKPKITDARIFAADADHPNGWGTILIGGFRLGGSCSACTPGTGAPPMAITADFDGSGPRPSETRTFYSAYFILDVTNPEVPPKLLTVFTTSSLGLSTSYPAVVRVNPTDGSKTDDTNAKWFMMVGSGMTDYAGTSTQASQIFAVDLQTGNVSTFATSDTNAFMTDGVTYDTDLDFRADAMYIGNSISSGSTPPWIGKLYRLTTTGCGSAPCSTLTWGIEAGSNRVPTVVISAFPSGGSTLVGPITSAPTITRDDSNNTWVFFGTGRFLGPSDKSNTDTQYLLGVKDPVMSGGCTQSTVTNCERQDLVDVSSATICSVCSNGTNQVTGVAGVTTLEGTTSSSLQGLVASKDGWYTTLPTSGERVVNAPTLLGGIIFFPTFVPVSDICTAAGTSNLYALFYLTGSAYKESVIGTTTAGGNTNVNRSMSLGTGTGLASQMAVHMGAQGSGAGGSAGAGTGCQSGTTGYIQSSTGTLSSFCAKTGQTTSRYISWINERS